MTGHRVVVNGVLLSVSLAVALVAAELLLRAFGLAPQQNVDVWSSRTRVVHDGECRYYERVNSLGLRDARELGLEGKARQVAFLGDSFVWGMGVSNDETFATLAEQLLEDETGLAWTVVAAGRRGIGTVEEARVLAGIVEKARLDAVVVFYFVDNDPWDNLWEEAVSTGSAPSEEVARGHGAVQSVALKGWLYRHVALYRFARSRLASAGTLRDFPFRLLDQCRPEKADSFRDADELTRRSLEVMRQEVERRGGRFLGVVIIPRQEQIDSESFRAFLASYHAEPSLYDRTLPQRRVVERVLRPGGYAYLDLTDVLGGRSRGELYFPLDGHFNPAGHRAVALAVSSWVLERWAASEPSAR
jgi:hypothetical protein